MSNPFLSVVAVNYNARAYIVACLDSVFQSTYQNFEVILVDNNSRDGSLEHLRERLPANYLSRIRIIENKENYGAAAALNQGARCAIGEFITFVATDTRVDRDCFRELVSAFQRDETAGALSAKLLMMSDYSRIDSAGEYLNQFGLLMQRHAGLEIDKGQFDSITELFSVKGTALTVRAEVFRKVGEYPEDYFMFLEETDLCWRIWLQDYRILFVPSARIYHASGASISADRRKNYLVKYFGCRNYIMTLFKNLGCAYLWRILPVHVFLWLGLAAYFTVHLRAHEGWYILKAVGWNAAHLPYLIKKRRAVQRSRRLTDSRLMPRILRPVHVSYLWDRVGMW